MQFSAALVAAFLAATATALPVAGEDASAPAAPQRWGMPIINHRPVDRRSPRVHIIDKIPVPEKRDDGDGEEEEGDAQGADPERRRLHMPIVDKIPVPEKRDDGDGEEEEGDAQGADPERRRLHMPIVDHRPSDRRSEDAATAAAPSGNSRVANAFWGMPIIDHRPSDRRAEAAATEEPKSAIAKAFWGMPIINHIPYPGKRRREQQAELERRGRAFPVVDHRPVPRESN